MLYYPKNIFKNVIFSSILYRFTVGSLKKSIQYSVFDKQKIFPNIPYTVATVSLVLRRSSYTVDIVGQKIYKFME